MQFGLVRCASALAFALSVSWPAFGQTGALISGTELIKRKVPRNVILVKGAWSSASDSATPVPEGGNLTNNVFHNKYFGISYHLPPDWIEKYTGPPPSDGGRYVLAQLRRPVTYKGDARGNILITAQDMFFTPLPVANALQLVDYTRSHLQADYKLEPGRTEPENAGQQFATLAYWSPVAGLHWSILATEIRCHTVEFVFMNRDRKTLESTVAQASRMKLPREAGASEGTGGGGVPVCIKDYANGGNVIERVDPFFIEQRFNPVPVRIIIDKKGRVKHIHFLSAFPDQVKAISDALSRWKFRPYLRDGHAVEVETGIMFGRAPGIIVPAKRAQLQPWPRTSPVLTENSNSDVVIV
jgi:hypothetical protein